MIYDHLLNLTHYKDINHNLDLAIDYLLSHDLRNLDVGTYHISPEVILMVQSNQLGESFDHIFEYHKKYLDIHYVIEGHEVIKLGKGDKVEVEEYLGDIGFIKCSEEASFDLRDNYIAFFFLEEAHQPNGMGSLGNYVKKGVLKVLMA
ncbi:TPA: YhcH/YjgK/YiaL family protein [Streptococcus agalactiae]